MLSLSPTTFSLGPRSEMGQRQWQAPARASVSVCEVQARCSVTPPATPISATPALCKLGLTTSPGSSKHTRRCGGCSHRLLGSEVQALLYNSSLFAVSIDLLLYRSIDLFIYQSISVSIYLSIIYLYIYTYLSSNIYLSIYLSSIYHLSLYLSI